MKAMYFVLQYNTIIKEDQIRNTITRLLLMYKLARNQHYTYDGRDDRYIKYGIWNLYIY